MKKLLLACVVFLTACQPDIAELEKSAIKEYMRRNPESTVQSAGKSICGSRVLVKMLGYDWREFINKWLDGHDISYILRVYAKTPYEERIAIEGLMLECTEKDISVLYSEKD